MPFPLLSIIATAAPILAKLIARDKVKASDVIGTIADRLGIDPTPEAIEDAYDADSGPVVEIIQEINEAEIARAFADSTISFHDVLKGDQGGSWIARNWRPLVSIAFGIECLLLIMAVCFAILFDIPINSELLPLISLAGTTLTVQAGVVGVYTYQRTQEKKARVA